MCLGVLSPRLLLKEILSFYLGQTKKRKIFLSSVASGQKKDSPETKKDRINGPTTQGPYGGNASLNSQGAVMLIAYIWDVFLLIRFINPEIRIYPFFIVFAISSTGHV